MCRNPSKVSVRAPAREARDPARDPCGLAAEGLAAEGLAAEGLAAEGLAAEGLAAEEGLALESLRGRLVEFSSAPAQSAVLTHGLRLVLEAQLAKEPSAWIGPGNSSFFPPDAAALGVDLSTLVVVRSPERQAMFQAADQLLRSGGFGLLVLDLIADPGWPAGSRGVTGRGVTGRGFTGRGFTGQSVTGRGFTGRGARNQRRAPAGSAGSGGSQAASLARLASLARKHRSVVLFLTEKSADTPSLGPRVAVRAEARRGTRLGDGFECVLEILRDKRGAPVFDEAWKASPERLAQQALKQEDLKQEDLKQEDPKQEDPKQEDPKQEDPKQEDPKQEDPKQQALKQEDLKQEDLKQEDLKQEDLKQEDLKQEDLKQQASASGRGKPAPRPASSRVLASQVRELAPSPQLRTEWYRGPAGLH